jgi:hypothetical protein
MSKVPAIISSAGRPAAVTIAQPLGPPGMAIHVLSNMGHAAVRYFRFFTSSHQTELDLGQRLEGQIFG